EVALELQDVADIGATERIDRVVGHQAVGDEVVCRPDVEVVHRAAELDWPNAHNEIECSRLVDHHHARTYGRCGHERERVLLAAVGGAGKTGGEADRDVEHGLHVLDHFAETAEVRMRGLEAPAL